MTALEPRIILIRTGWNMGGGEITGFVLEGNVLTSKSFLWWAI